MKIFSNSANIKSSINIKSLLWLTALLITGIVTGCGGGGGSFGSGTLGVSITDAPACGFDRVNVTVVKVRVHTSSSAADNDAGWAEITLNPARKINLLDLNNGVLQSLGETSLAAGHYTQLRLVLDPNTALGLANSVVPTGGLTEYPLITPSSVQSGIKLVNEFDVAPGKRVDLLLDFNACKSVLTRSDGKYSLKPVVNVIPFELNGIDGFVDNSLLADNVLVTAQQNGVIVRSTAPNATTGEFFLTHLVPGNYDVVITANGHATAVIATVPVLSTSSVTLISSSAYKTNLLPSTSHTVSGTLVLNPTSASTDAYIAAKQTFTGPLNVSVKEVIADDSALPSGAYSLTLPIAEPQLGQYSATLPISLVTQTGLAGQYSIQASATGYATQSSNKDIATTDVTADFTLIP